MTTINSINSTVLIILLVAGLMMGLAFAGTDLLNPRTSSAEANRMNIEATHQQAVYELQERLAAAKTNAEIQAIQREEELLDAQYEHDIRALAQDLEHRDISFKTWMTVLTFVGSALSIAIIIGTILWIGSKALANMRTIPVFTEARQKITLPVEKTIRPLAGQEPDDPWITPAYRRQKIKAARREERKQRKDEITARMKAFRDPARMSKEEYKKRPLAG